MPERNASINLMTNQKPLHQFSTRFYLWQIVILTFSGLFCFWFSRQEVWDHAITSFWFDSVSNQFPLKDSYWLDLINHRLLKYLVIAIAVVLLFRGFIQRRTDMISAALLIGLGSAVVGILKSVSLHSCPWDLIEYGGRAMEYPLLSSANYFDGPGHCFPGGHASGGFSLMALYFLFYPKNKNMALFALGSGMFLGQLMGFGQVMRGAHFLSHNLWSCWWVWASQVSVYWLISSLLPVSFQQKIIAWSSVRSKAVDY